MEESCQKKNPNLSDMLYVTKWGELYCAPYNGMINAVRALVPPSDLDHEEGHTGALRFALSYGPNNRFWYPQGDVKNRKVAVRY